MRRYIVHCETISTFPDFVAAVNAGFVGLVGGSWNGNLDAFNDYLSWPPEHHYELELAGSAQCAHALDHGAMAEWLRHKLTACHPENVQHVKGELALAEAARGKTLFAVIREIIAANSHVHLICS